MIHNDRNLGLNLAVSAGQEFVTTVADYLRYALGLESTTAVGLFLETVRDPAGFRSALQLARERDVPVVALKVGREERTRELVDSMRSARDSQEKLQTIVDTALDAVVRMDVAGHIVGWNSQAEKIFGWTRDEALGQPLEMTIIPPRYRDAHRDGMRRYLESGGASGAVLDRRIEIHALRRDGTEFDARPGEVTHLPAGHDAYVVGNEPVVVVDFFGASQYAKT